MTAMTDEVVHIVVIGVAGSGKTTVALLLAERTGRPYAEADDFHPPKNVALMAAGTPLTDAERWPWLEALRAWLDAQSDAGRSTVMTCSALRRPYRDLLRTARGRVVFVHLDGAREILQQRITGRSGHFMKPEMLTSQLAALEPLEPDEDGFVVDLALTPEEIVAQILERVTAV
ncbi:gluconokinase [Antribacter gilvus]|uniref:gluconokinase n=1 Tax=Antribacter gilvus TaxID=2304675 RepID=UPI000F77B0DC|nr:gluconokinase [Antribacter gilvus]